MCPEGFRQVAQRLGRSTPDAFSQLHELRYFGTPEAIDALLGVPHGKQPSLTPAFRHHMARQGRQTADDFLLQGIDVLILVHQQVVDAQNGGSNP